MGNRVILSRDGEWGLGKFRHSAFVQTYSEAAAGSGFYPMDHQLVELAGFEALDLLGTVPRPCSVTV